MSTKNRENRISQYGGRIAYFILLIVLIPVALAFWPKTGKIGKPARNGGETRASTGAAAIAAVTHGMPPVCVTLSDEDLNAYFEKMKSSAWGLESLSVAAMPGFFSVRMVRPLVQFGFKIKDAPAGIKLSYDIVCVPLDGGNVSVARAAIGHLPMPSAFKPAVARAILGTMIADKDLVAFKNATSIKADDGQLTITVQP